MQLFIFCLVNKKNNQNMNRNFRAQKDRGLIFKMTVKKLSDMKKTLILAAALLVSFTVLAQKEATRKLSSFSEISAHEGIQVHLKQGSSEEAKIKVEGNISMDEVLTEVSGGKLKIHLEDNNYRNIDVEVWVTYKSLSAVSASSAADIDSESRIVTSGNFKVSVSSAGDIDLDVKANSIDIKASSAGDITLKAETSSIDASANSAGSIEISGTAKSLDVSVNSSGDFEGFDLSAETAEVSASSGGSAEVNVSEQLNARASSGGSVKYKGNPRMDISSNSGGSIRKS